MKQYDLAILGGGPGGYVAAIRAAQLGLTTAIIDQDKLGGICLNWGCIPTKALLKNAEVLDTVKNAKNFGINIPSYKVDFAKTIRRSRQISERLSKGIDFLMKKNNITHIIGRGSFIAENKIEVKNGRKQVAVQAKHFIIATGGRPKVYPGMDFDDNQVISSKEAMILNQPPEEMVIVGAGAIGAEFAYFYNSYGTKVTLLEMMDRVLPMEDEEVSKELEENFIKIGIAVHTSTTVERIETLKTKVKVHIKHGNKKELIECSVALLAVGITGNTEDLGLEKIGIKIKKGAVLIDDYGQTTVSNIFAIGDVTGPPWLAHVASAQGHVAAEKIAGHPTFPVDYSNIPACTYCQPQVASLGLTEAQARDAGHDVKVGKFNFRSSGKAMAMGSMDGFVKIVFDAKYGELLGCHIIGAEATELIAELAMAKGLEATWQDLARTVHAHPTLSEAIMEAALDAFGRAIHQ